MINGPLRRGGLDMSRLCLGATTSGEPGEQCW